MSLLERLGRNPIDNEEKQQDNSLKMGGLHARLKANHQDTLMGADIDDEIKGTDDKAKITIGKILENDQEETKILKQNETNFALNERYPANTAFSPDKADSHNLGIGLSAKLGLAQRNKIFSAQNEAKIVQPTLPTGARIEANNYIMGENTKKAEKLATEEKIIENLNVNNGSSVILDTKVKKSIDTQSSSRGLGEKLGLGTRSGLGLRLGKEEETSSIHTISGVNKSVLNSKITAAQPLNPEQNKYQNLKIEIHRQIIEELSVEQQKIIANSSSDRSELERIVVELCNRVIDGDNPTAMSRADRANIVKDIVDEVLGLGPIESLLKDETVSEVMINGPEMVYIERRGKLKLTSVQFRDEMHLMNIIERIVAPLGRRIDESSPLVDARLADGSRVNIIIPPLALNGACVTIRKFAKDPLTINNLIGFGSLNEDMASLIQSCVLGRLNIVVSGGTGSGKTTTLNVLSSFIPEDERIVTIEDAAELQLRQDHVVTLESRPANVEGTGQVSIRDLVRNALRMRPDRIVVGECRSGEALDMLQAMNTGHDGSLTTAHANSPRDVISRLETMVLMAGMELPVKAIREQIASAVDLIIQQSRLRDGSRKITYITEVQGMEGDVIVLQDIFRFEQDGLDENGKLRGEFRTSGIRPKFLDKLEVNGIKFDANMFIGNRGWSE